MGLTVTYCTRKAMHGNDRQRGFGVRYSPSTLPVLAFRRVGILCALTPDLN